MTTLTISKRGTITLPPDVRRKLGLEKASNPLLIMEERDGGIFLQPATAIPVRDLTRDQIQQWITDDEKDMAALKVKRGKKTP
jgi:AbrB family looped-hinge helix DNA binding protein